MRSFHVSFIGFALLFISCNRVDTSASFRKIVSTPIQTTRDKSLPFVADSLLSFSHEQVVKLFGENSLIRDPVSSVDNGSRSVVRLFAATNREVELIFNDSTLQAHVVAVTIRKNSIWTTESGLKAGMTLQDVEKLNGRAFMFYGGGWDNGGIITNWNNGAVHLRNLKNCRLDRSFVMPYDLSKGDYHAHEFSSSANDAQIGNPVIEEIVLVHN
jgi:hypothetical protein